MYLSDIHVVLTQARLAKKAIEFGHSCRAKNEKKRKPGYGFYDMLLGCKMVPTSRSSTCVSRLAPSEDPIKELSSARRVARGTKLFTPQAEGEMYEPAYPG